MIRSLKILGLMAVAALAMSAMLASGAQANPPGTFTAGDTDNAIEPHTETEIHGEQYGTNNRFTFEEEATECSNEETTFTGSDSDGTANEITIQPHYTHCMSGGLPSTVTMTECDYNFDQPETDGTHFTGTVDLVCPPGQAVHIHVYLFGGVTSHSTQVCELTVTPFENKGDITYTKGEKDEKDDLTLDIDVGGIPVHKAGTCGESSGEATYESNVTVTASAFNEPHDLWISKEEA